MDPKPTSEPIMSFEHEFKAIGKYISTLPVFSDHDHHERDKFFHKGMTLDKLINQTYVSWTGYQSDGSAESRAALLDNVRFNSYYTWFEKGLQALHNIDEPITVDNWDAISAKITARYAGDSDFHWQSMLDAGFERMILDAYWDPGDDDGHGEVFVPTFRIDKFLYGFHRESIAPNEFAVWDRYSFDGGDLDDYVENMRAIIGERVQAGKAVAFKCAEAYNRDIHFVPDDKAAAEEAFGLHPDKISQGQRLAFSNYIFNRCCELAGELDMPFQIHTGLAILSGSQPMNFEPIIAKYPHTRFVLFHSGFPWTHQVAGLAHNYRNALPSLTWTATICTSSAIRALHDFIDVASSCNEITWGSDCWTPEESVGTLLAWRFVVARALAERLVDGRCTANDAEALAQKLMYENGRNVYCPNWKP